MDFHKSYAEAAQLRDRLGSDRTALEGFIDRVTSLSARTPEIEAKMDAIQAKFGVIEEGTQKAMRAGELAGELEAQLNRVTGRLQFVEQVDGRINGTE